jgi:hypothetical protein
MSDNPYTATVNLSLVSHTNAGKTTLVRTLLGQDVGEVRDAAHVTDQATGYVLVQSGADTLMLWDTPGFGDTGRLLKRLRISGNPIGWLLTQVWDRFRERPLWSSQQAVRNARDHADVVLYLVNAAEDPAGAAYVPLEMELLAWIGKPVILLLNQMGPPRADANEEVERWRTHLASSGVVAGALPLDAFARCWVQEATLLDTVGPLLPPEKQATLDRLTLAWRERNLARFHAAMHILATPLAAAVADREPVSDRNWRDKVGDALGGLRQEAPAEARRAMASLANRLEAGTRSSTEQLIDVHGLTGNAVREVLQRLRDDYASSAPAKEGYSAMLGGLMSGAVGGLAADLAAGGLTLGGGMIVGGLLGAIGAGGLARGYNMARGEEGAAVRWSEEFFAQLIQSALLRYLAVAHFGRGRGDFAQGEHPAFWQAAVAEVAGRRRGQLRAIWDSGKEDASDRVVSRIEALLTDCGAELLVRLYPEARDLFVQAPAPSATVAESAGWMERMGRHFGPLPG